MDDNLTWHEMRSPESLTVLACQRITDSSLTNDGVPEARTRCSGFAEFHIETDDGDLPSDERRSHDHYQHCNILYTVST